MSDTVVSYIVYARAPSSDTLIRPPALAAELSSEYRVGVLTYWKCGLFGMAGIHQRVTGISQNALLSLIT